MKKDRYAYYDFTQERLGFEPVFLLGSCRSGKSSLGRLMGSLRDHYHVEEDWLLLMLPLMARAGLVDRRVFVNMARAWISEKVYDVVLMRSASFRPTDHSYVARMKTAGDIETALTRLRGRGDVDRYLRSSKVRVIFNLAELGSCADLLKEIHPRALYIHVDRSADAQAADIRAKAWYDQAQLVRPSNRQLYRLVRRNGRTLYLPFWVRPAHTEAFLRMGAEERARYYVSEHRRLTLRARRRAGRLRWVDVRYEDLLRDPPRVLKAVAPGARAGGRTAELVRELRRRGRAS
ncbi:MAG: hypothetical protein MOGMAGMI_00845 [Candidatus Omnitrophica bacterium]|nr:hypothetical protein [Candidatus Omnitrophota bacterium]